MMLASHQKLQASHSMGSDLTYRCLGGNSYEITLSFYRDCAGVEADTAALIHFNSSCFGDDTLTIYQIPGTGQEISPCLLYTSDAADERSSVDLGGRRIIKKKKTVHVPCQHNQKRNKQK